MCKHCHMWSAVRLFSEKIKIHYYRQRQISLSKSYISYEKIPTTSSFQCILITLMPISNSALCILIIIWWSCQFMAKNAGKFYCIWTLSKVLGSGKHFLPSSSRSVPSNFQLVYKPMCILNEMNTYILDSFTLNSPRWFRRHPINLWFVL